MAEDACSILRKSSIARIRRGAREFNLDTSTVEKIYNSLKASDSGQIDTQQFRTLLLFASRRAQGAENLTKDDLKAFLDEHGTHLSEKEMDVIYNSLDVEQKGYVTAQALLSFCQKHNSRMGKSKQSADCFLTIAQRIQFELQTNALLESLKQTYGPRYTHRTHGDPHSRLKHKFLEESTVGFLGIPLSGGQHIEGVELTPDAFRRDTTLFEEASGIGWQIVDWDDVDIETVWEEVDPKLEDPTDVHMHHCHYVGACSEVIADAVHKVCESGQFCLNIGGDHSIAFGTFCGVLRARPNSAFIFVDAHADINVPECSPSGNLHGMPVSAHLRITDFTRWPGWKWLDTRITPADIVFIGLRDLDENEMKILRGIGAHVFDRHRIQKLGIGTVMETAMGLVNPYGNRPIHLSFDIDAVDELYAPSTGTIAPGGLNWRESVFICEYLAKTGCLCSMDLAEINTNILYGAQAGDHETVITKQNASEKQLSRFELERLQHNPKKTLELGKQLIKAALGEFPMY